MRSTQRPRLEDDAKHQSRFFDIPETGAVTTTNCFSHQFVQQGIDSLGHATCCAAEKTGSSVRNPSKSGKSQGDESTVKVEGLGWSMVELCRTSHRKPVVGVVWVFVLEQWEQRQNPPGLQMHMVADFCMSTHLQIASRVCLVIHTRIHI